MVEQLKKLPTLILGCDCFLRGFPNWVFYKQTKSSKIHQKRKLPKKQLLSVVLCFSCNIFVSVIFLFIVYLNKVMQIYVYKGIRMLL